MPRYEQRDRDGNITDVFVVTEETLKADPEAVIKSRGPVKGRAPAAPEGYEHIATLDHDPDALVSDVSLHVYAKKGKYEKEKLSKLAGLKAVIAEAEAKAETKLEGVK
jgi:hypothetical protein